MLYDCTLMEKKNEKRKHLEKILKIYTKTPEPESYFKKRCRLETQCKHQIFDTITFFIGPLLAVCSYS